LLEVQQSASTKFFFLMYSAFAASSLEDDGEASAKEERMTAIFITLADVEVDDGRMLQSELHRVSDMSSWCMLHVCVLVWCSRADVDFSHKINEKMHFIRSGKVLKSEQKVVERAAQSIKLPLHLQCIECSATTLEPHMTTLHLISCDRDVQHTYSSTRSYAS